MFNIFKILLPGLIITILINFPINFPICEYCENHGTVNIAVRLLQSPDTMPGRIFPVCIFLSKFNFAPFFEQCMTRSDPSVILFDE